MLDYDTYSYASDVWMCLSDIHGTELYDQE